MAALPLRSIKSLMVTAGLLASSPSWADMRILESNVPGIRVGAVFPVNTLPVLPPGGNVLVVYLSNNTTRRFFGPQENADTRPFGGTRGKQAPK